MTEAKNSNDTKDAEPEIRPLYEAESVSSRNKASIPSQTKTQ